MKRVTAFVGSAHKKNTHKAAVQFLNNLQALGDVEYEIVTLSDYRLGICRGCRLCFEKGEEFCPLKDDRDVLMDKIMASIVEYFDFVGGILGFNTVKGSCVTALDPRTEKDQQKIDRALAEHSKRFYARLAKPAYPVPTLFMLMGFRMGRTTVRQMLDDRSRDYSYYAEKGWFESDYFYPTRLGALKKVAGHLFDSMAPTLRKMLA